jgi:hypothetical protein
MSRDLLGVEASYLSGMEELRKKKLKEREGKGR